MSIRRAACVAASLSLLGFISSGSLVAQESAPAAPQEVPLNTLTEKASYVIGYDIGTNIKAQGLTLEIAVFLRGMAEALEGKANRMTPEQVNATMEEYQKVVFAEQESKMKAEGEKNLRAGQEFLQANALKEGVKVLESGLQYKVVTAGNGPSPTVNDRVKTHYKGTLINGEVFDSSYDRGEPAVFPVGGVIRGWVEALQRMKVGDKWILYVPSEMAYGPEGAGGAIGPNEVLVFEIELLEIVK